MKYRIVKVELDTSNYYEVEVWCRLDRADTTYESITFKEWKTECKFNTISAAEQYIQSKAQPKRTVIKEYEV